MAEVIKRLTELLRAGNLTKNQKVLLAGVIADLKNRSHDIPRD